MAVGSWPEQRPSPARPSRARKKTPLDKVDHIVVIYEENHSFDNLYGGWEGVNGRANATAAKTTQVDQQGAPYACLKQNDVNLAALPARAPTVRTASRARSRTRGS